MSSTINKQSLERLAKLARIELGQDEEKKLTGDLSKILDHFKELESIDTSNVSPMTGGTELKNNFREDGDRENTHKGDGVDAFPEKKGGFLRVPPVFE